MSRLLFKENEVTKDENAVFIELPKRYKKYQELSKVSEQKLASDLASEQSRISKEKIEKKIKSYEAAAENIKEAARKESQKIIEEAREESEKLIRETKENIKKKEESIQLQSAKITEKAKLEADKMLKEAEARVANIEKEAYQKGQTDGSKFAYEEEKKNIIPLIDRLGVILSEATDVREQIIRESEKQIVDMILIIARKVIKDETIERKEIVLNNVREALRKVKDKEKINIRVNFSDLDITTSHKDEILKMIESLKKVNIYEDSRVDRGGVIIQTEIGDIDARIFTQIKEIEEAIQNVKPL